MFFYQSLQNTPIMQSKQSKPAAGRPRLFDTATALERAMEVFWLYGYEAASIKLLTEAMQLSAPSVYAAFGNKQQLFTACIDLYNRHFGVRIGAILEDAASAERGIEECLVTLAHTAVSGARRGCMIVTSAVNCSEESQHVKEMLRSLRRASEASLRERIAQDKDAGVLPCHVDAAGLAKFYAAVIQGMAIQAQDGCTTTELLAITKQAMQAWPRYPA